MPYSCKASYQFTVEELVRSMTFHSDLALRRSYRIGATIFFSLFLVLLSLALTVMLFDEREDGHYVPIFIFLILLSTGIIFALNVRRRIWSQQFEARPDKNTTRDWEFTEEEVKIRTELGESTNKWKGFFKVVEVTEGFLIYPVENIVYWIPFDAFEKPECIDRVRGFIIKNKCQFIQQK